ncbi:uncharacterized protein HaLaN_10307, partial [Haematococcus lacustris]
MRRTLQNVRRKFEMLVTAPDMGPIGRLKLPGRALMPPGVLDSVVPIHDAEITSIIAHCLTSRQYLSLLNAAIKDCFN